MLVINIYNVATIKKYFPIQFNFRQTVVYAHVQICVLFIHIDEF